MQTAVLLSGLQLIQMGPAIDHRAEGVWLGNSFPSILAARLQSGQQLHSSTGLHRSSQVASLTGPA